MGGNAEALRLRRAVDATLAEEVRRAWRVGDLAQGLRRAAGSIRREDGDARARELLRQVRIECEDARLDLLHPERERVVDGRAEGKDGGERRASRLRAAVSGKDRIGTVVEVERPLDAHPPDRARGSREEQSAANEEEPGPIT